MRAPISGLSLISYMLYYLKLVIDVLNFNWFRVASDFISFIFMLSHNEKCAVGLYIVCTYIVY